jgi:hypothetical protein
LALCLDLSFRSAEALSVVTTFAIKRAGIGSRPRSRRDSFRIGTPNRFASAACGMPEACRSHSTPMPRHVYASALRSPRHTLDRLLGSSTLISSVFVSRRKHLAADPRSQAAAGQRKAAHLPSAAGLQAKARRTGRDHAPAPLDRVHERKSQRCHIRRLRRSRPYFWPRSLAPINVVDTDILTMVRFCADDASVIVSCSRPDQMAVTRSPHRPGYD